MNFIIRLLITAAAAYGLTHILSGVHLAGFESAIILAMTDSHFVYLYIINIYIILIVKYKLSKVPLVFSNKL